MSTLILLFFLPKSMERTEEKEEKTFVHSPCANLKEFPTPGGNSALISSLDHKIELTLFNSILHCGTLKFTIFLISETTGAIFNTTDDSTERGAPPPIHSDSCASDWKNKSSCCGWLGYPYSIRPLKLANKTSKLSSLFHYGFSRSSCFLPLSVKFERRILNVLTAQMNLKGSSPPLGLQ